MLGAICGDIVGSRFEFNNIFTKEFDFFGQTSDDCFITDDSVMTAAVADALLRADPLRDEDAFRAQLVRSMKAIGRKYPYAGYGSRFYHWLFSENTQPYNSYGNGSAMRVSPVAWYASSLEETERIATLTAEVTHNHPEGIKGAVCTAGAQYLARTGASREEICAYITTHYPDCFTRSRESLLSGPRFNETCQGTVPQAMVAFAVSESYEDAIRTAISLGGDSDTIAAITGAVAEAYWGMPVTLRAMTLPYMPRQLASITADFTARYVDGRRAER